MSATKWFNRDRENIEYHISSNVQFNVENPQTLKCVLHSDHKLL